MATAGDFLGALTMLARGGDGAPPPSFYAAVERMYDYGAFVSSPRGCLPRNGDSDVCGAGFSTASTSYFNRSDWTYAHTNGAQGTPPDDARGPSRVWPWAGEVVMRSSWGAAATWAFLDVGPYVRVSCITSPDAPAIATLTTLHSPLRAPHDP